MDVRAYAALVAELARADRPREEILAAHGLDEDAWQGVDERFQAEISRALDEAEDGIPPIVRAYDEAYRLAQAEGRLLSFDEYVAATRLLQQGGDVTAALARLGVTADQLVRANAHWSRRMIADPALADRFVRRR